MKDHYYRGWNHVNGVKIDKFIKHLTEEQEELEDNGVKISDADKRQHFLEQVLECPIFEDCHYGEWEAKLPAEQGWDDAIKHWQGVMDVITTRERNARGTAKKARYESANNTKEREREQQEEQQQ